MITLNQNGFLRYPGTYRELDCYKKSVVLYDLTYWYITRYLQMDEVQPVSSPNPAPGRRRITLGVQGEQVATGFENVQGDNVQCTKVLINGELFILRGEKMYDAKGQLVK